MGGSNKDIVKSRIEQAKKNIQACRNNGDKEGVKHWQDRIKELKKQL